MRLITFLLSTATNIISSENNTQRNQSIHWLNNLKTTKKIDMKKLLLAVFMLTATFSIIGVSAESVYARSGGSTNSIPASQVPKAVKKDFKSMYSTATQIEWEFKPMVPQFIQQAFISDLKNG